MNCRELLLSRKDQIIDRWSKQILEDPEISPGRKASGLVLSSQAADLLDVIAVRLVELCGDSATSWNRGWKPTGHWVTGDLAVPWPTDTFTLPETLRELSHLRFIIFDELLTASIPISSAESAMLNAFIDESMTKAAEAIAYHRRQGVAAELNQAHQGRELADEGRRMAEAASSRKSEFLAHVSHEIRSPLGAILGFTELLLGPDQPIEEKEKYLKAILRNGRQLLLLLNDILDLSKVESGRIQTELAEVSVSDVVNEVLFLSSDRAQEKGLALMVGVDGRVPRTIVSDAAKIRQILINIVGNAVKFTSQGRIELRVAYRENADRLGKGHLVFTIEDTGVGISVDQHELARVS